MLYVFYIYTNIIRKLILAFTFYFTRISNNKTTIFYLGFLFIIAISVSGNINKITKITYQIVVFVVIYIFAVYIMRFIKDKYIEKIRVSSKISWLLNILSCYHSFLFILIFLGLLRTIILK